MREGGDFSGGGFLELRLRLERFSECGAVEEKKKKQREIFSFRGRKIEDDSVREAGRDFFQGYFSFSGAREKKEEPESERELEGRHLRESGESFLKHGILAGSEVC